MEKQIKDLAVRVFGMSDEEANSLFEKTEDGSVKLSDNLVDTFSSKHRDRIEKMQNDHRDQLTEIHDRGYKKAQKESLTKFEQQLKEKYGVNSDKFGIDLVDDVVSNVSKKSLDDIKTHPDYVSLEKKLQDEFIPKQKFDETLSEYENFKKNVERNNTLSKVKDDARNIFRSLNPVLSKDPKKAANQEADFLAKLDGFDYQVDQSGNHLIMKDGKRIENENYNPVKFDDFVKNTASNYFDFSEQPVRGNSGVDPNEGGSSMGFKDKSDFLKSYNAETDPSKRVKMFESAANQGIIEKPVAN